MISSLRAHPWEVHIMAAFHIMVYLNQKHNSHFSIYPTYPLIDNNTFNDGADWK